MSINYKLTKMDEVQTLHEEGQIIIITDKEVVGHGVCVTLDEYNNMTGFLLISEIAMCWIRKIGHNISVQSNKQF